MKRSDDNIEKTLSALDGVERAATPADFEDKLYERLRFTPQWMRWFQYSAAALLLFALLNVLTMLYLSSGTATPQVDYMEEALFDYEEMYPVITYSEE